MSVAIRIVRGLPGFLPTVAASRTHPGGYSVSYTSTSMLQSIAGP
jgi:hypothetical protein